MGKELEKKVLAVPGRGQIREKDCVRIEDPAEGAPRILFLGNSITWHSPCPPISWHGDWGMAASSREKDYVHLVMHAIKERYPNAVFCIVNGAAWETTLETCNYEGHFSLARDFHADIIVNTVEANIPVESFDGTVFKRELERLHRYLCPAGAKGLIMASSICHIAEKDAAIEAYAKEKGAHYVYIGDVFEKEENLAVGLYDHEGVAHHPGDRGMRCLAQRYVTALCSIIDHI